MRLSAIDPDGDLSAGGAELLEEATIRPDPQVLLRYLHLGARVNVTRWESDTRRRRDGAQLTAHR